MRKYLAIALGLLLCACASTKSSTPYPSDPQFQRIEALHSSQDWTELSNYAATAFRDYQFEVYANEEVNLALWRIVDACEQTQQLDTHALALRALACLADPDAPLAVLEFARAHGREPLERCGALQRPEIVTWLAMEADCQRGDWVAARQRIADNFPEENGVMHFHAVASHFLLGDLLRRAERSEAALHEYTTGTFGRASMGDPFGYLAIHERTLGCVRMESLLFDMGEGNWAASAMEIVNQQRKMLVYFPRTHAVDEAVRAAMNAEIKIVDSVLWHYDNPKAPELAPFAEDLAALKIFDAPQSSGNSTTWSAPKLGLKLITTDEVLRVESTQSSVGNFEVAWTSATWEYGPKCTLYTEPANSKGRCMRRFRDGSIYLGSAGFDSLGLLLRRDQKPYSGSGLYGRPSSEALQLVSFRSNEAVEGPTIRGLGERRKFIASVACGAFLIGEGYIKGTKLVPDGLVRLAYSSDAWFRTHFTLGVAAPWRRSGNVILPSDLSRIEDLSGQQQVWIDPAQWKERIKKAEELAAATQREQFERQFRAQMEVWSSMSQGGSSGGDPVPEAGGYPCFICNGVGSIYGSGRWESYTYYEQKDAASLPTPRTGTRWVNGQRENCPKCFGSGKQ